MVNLFTGVIGHERVISLLEREAQAPGHAYLFTGPAGVGKATVARRFAASLLCDADDEDCHRRVQSAAHPDLILVEPDGASALTVDQARRTVARDLDFLRDEERAPLDYDETRHGCRLTDETYTLSPVRISRKEAFSFALARKLLVHYEATPLHLDPAEAGLGPGQDRRVAGGRHHERAGLAESRLAGSTSCPRIACGSILWCGHNCRASSSAARRSGCCNRPSPGESRSTNCIPTTAAGQGEREETAAQSLSGD